MMSPPETKTVRVVASVSERSTRSALVLHRIDLMRVRALPQLRYQLTRVGPVGLTGIVLLVAAFSAGLVLLVPATKTVSALRAELAAPHPAVLVREPIERTAGQFTAALPTRADIPAVLNLVLAQATTAGVTLEQGRYTFNAATPTRLARYTFEFPVKADYASIRAFIDKSLAASPAIGLDKLQLERKAVGDVAISAQVGFIIYLRGA